MSYVFKYRECQRKIMPKEKWRICEDTKKVEYESKGCKVATTGKGSDFVAVCPDKPLIFVEVKQGCGPLSKLQKKTKDEVTKKGAEYRTERCSCHKKIER
jgi:hypothetical protein